MEIENQFNLIAEEYDKNRKKFIPCFDGFYKDTTDFVAYNISKPRRILDLGAGTGLLSYFYYKHFPEAQYVLVDIAEGMLNVAKKRFDGSENITYELLDYSTELPAGGFDLIISALSVHHLEDNNKQRLFNAVYDKFPRAEFL